MTPLMKTLHQKFERIFIWQFLIGFKSQGFLYKDSSIELGTPHETQFYLFYQTKIII